MYQVQQDYQECRWTSTSKTRRREDIHRECSRSKIRIAAQLHWEAAGARLEGEHTAKRLQHKQGIRKSYMHRNLNRNKNRRKCVRSKTSHKAYIHVECNICKIRRNMHVHSECNCCRTI